MALFLYHSTENRKFLHRLLHWKGSEFIPVIILTIDEWSVLINRSVNLVWIVIGKQSWGLRTCVWSARRFPGRSGRERERPYDMFGTKQDTGPCNVRSQCYFTTSPGHLWTLTDVVTIWWCERGAGPSGRMNNIKGILILLWVMRILEMSR